MFKDRLQAGRLLAEKLLPFEEDNPIIYALPRGGLPIAEEVAQKLKAPLDLILVRKLGAPGHEELAMGAIVDGAAPTAILNQDVVAELSVPNSLIESAKESALEEIERRRTLYMKGHPAISPHDRTIIIVDDGLATGATMQAAVTAMRKAQARHIIVAVPVAPQEAVNDLSKVADRVIVLQTPRPFLSVGSWYESFPQLVDEDVTKAIERSHSSASRTQT